jgi:hypothetical protein
MPQGLVRRLIKTLILGRKPVYGRHQMPRIEPLPPATGLTMVPTLLQKPTHGQRQPVKSFWGVAKW